MSHLIALTGLGGAGKDVLGAAFIAQGYQRLAPGDRIKFLFDDLCRRHLGYSAFTEDRALKEHLRPLLVHGGQTFYTHIFAEYFAEVDAARAQGVPVINTRLFRLEEAQEWRARGGVIWEVHRCGNEAKEPEEARSLAELKAAGFIDAVLYNCGTLADFEAQCASVAGRVAERAARAPR